MTEREKAARICEAMRPSGGRPWSWAQSACYEALTQAAEFIRHPEVIHPTVMERIRKGE